MSPDVLASSRLGALRPAVESDIEQLIALRERVFGHRIAPEQWRWKLGGRGCSVANVWVIDAGNRLIFQYAGIPTLVRHCGADRWAMVSVDTMTDPDYRRRGLLTKMGAETYAHWRQAGIPFVLGLPNEQWGSRSPTLGFTPVSELRWWVRWLDPLRMLAQTVGLHWSRTARAVDKQRSLDYPIAPIADPSPFDDLWRRQEAEGVIRDAAWFRWRYLDAVPPWTVLGAWDGHRLAGGAAFHLDSNPERPSGIIGEVLAQDLTILRRLLAGCCERMRSLGAVRAALLIQPGTVLEEAALATGFLPRSFLFSVRAVDLGGGLPRAALFQGGDFDVV
jgi:hypothetical protein